MIFSFHTGPTIVKQIADKFRAAGMTVAVEGTAHVLIHGDCRYALLEKLRSVHGTNFGLR
jgi:hypothetical protein